MESPTTLNEFYDRFTYRTCEWPGRDELLFLCGMGVFLSLIAALWDQTTVNPIGGFWTDFGTFAVVFGFWFGCMFAPASRRRIGAGRPAAADSLQLPLKTCVRLGAYARAHAFDRVPFTDVLSAHLESVRRLGATKSRWDREIVQISADGLAAIAGLLRGLDAAQPAVKQARLARIQSLCDSVKKVTAVIAQRAQHGEPTPDILSESLTARAQRIWELGAAKPNDDDFETGAETVSEG